MTHRRSVAMIPTSSSDTYEASRAGKASIQRRKRRRQPVSLSKVAIVVSVGFAEICIYYLYRSGDFFGISLDSITDAIVRPIEERLIPPHQRVFMTEEELNDMESTLERTSNALGYDQFEPLRIPKRKPTDFFQYTSKEEMGINYTVHVLQTMGVKKTELLERDLLDQIPPWWQVIDNYGKEPIILGMERCQIFRERVYRRHVAPAGMFSTGTNLLQQMLFDNCIPPHGGHRPRIFNLWQAPWGKHNPASARLHHIARHQDARNQSAVLPVVMVRHPYTWLFAVCRQPYALQWNHRQEYCDRSLFLKFVVEANFGSLRRKGNTTTGSTTGNTTYDSLIHVWRDWNLEYFLQNEYPMLMVRFEDLVFRPKQVVEQVCHCVGGSLSYDFNETEPFWYLLENANLGKGHGNHRSDLVSAVIRYGQPLDLYHRMYSSLDWSIIRDVLHDDHGLTGALGYKMRDEGRGISI